jgi:uncharacterized membrane protein (GlpM family)
MNWTRFFLAVLLSGFATSITDWLFMGVLFHKKYLATPEIWRIEAGQNDTRSIVLSSLLGVLSCAVFLYFCVRFEIILSHRTTLHASLLVWLAAAVPIIFSNIVWIKMDPLLGVSHSLGWLVRFVFTGIIGNWLLR